ncbi:adenosylcobinamide-GDP ribazoletransferase [Streptomyces cacaoi]|uniref:adenosylcobinamide-GDP ribazoletransferase n=1 Tax=Streptomyces cacaoi TaxID=1898 RepID=UPI003747FA73
MSTTSPFDGLRFAFGTLTVLPVRVTRWDREAARGGMLNAPVVGLVVGGCAAGLGLLLLYLGTSPLLAAVASAAVPAVLTRGLHLDGLADTADGLGSGKPAEDALRIMKQSDIGPFGVLTLLLVLLAQVAALTQLYDTSWALGAGGGGGSAGTTQTTLPPEERARGWGGKETWVCWAPSSSSWGGPPGGIEENISRTLGGGGGGFPLFPPPPPPGSR